MFIMSLNAFWWLLQAAALVGSAMTYSLFEYAKDNVDALMPDSLLHSSNVQVSVLYDYYFYLENIQGGGGRSGTLGGRSPRWLFWVLPKRLATYQGGSFLSFGLFIMYDGLILTTYIFYDLFLWKDVPIGGFHWYASLFRHSHPSRWQRSPFWKFKKFEFSLF